MISTDATAAPIRQGDVLGVSGGVLGSREARSTVGARGILGCNLRLGGRQWFLQPILGLSGRRDAATMDAAGAPERDRLAGHAAARPGQRGELRLGAGIPRPDSIVKDGPWEVMLAG